jgi:hypothetical protein
MTEEKRFEELTPEERKNVKVVFAPGCFDSFEGTQEELDELIANIQSMIDSGELFEQSTAVDLDELMDEDPELAEKIFNITDSTPRNLQ